VRYKKKDQYGRVLGVVWTKVKGEGQERTEALDVNLLMVKEGMAWHYGHFDKTPEYIEAQKSAQLDKRGLWADDKLVNPYDWRKAGKR